MVECSMSKFVSECRKLTISKTCIALVAIKECMNATSMHPIATKIQLPSVRSVSRNLNTSGA